MKQTLTKYIRQVVNDFWRITNPAMLSVRDFLVRIKVIHHNYRQPYYLGRLDGSKSKSEFMQHLEQHGFVNHFFAWKDPGQEYSLRKRVDFDYQYHLRIFTDGEIRGHYEFTPEAHPVAHMKEEGMEPRTEEFMKHLNGWLTDMPQIGSGVTVAATNQKKVAEPLPVGPIAR